MPGIASHTDIIAFDIYEGIQLDVFPLWMQSFLTESGKHTLWIGEFGQASLDDAVQSAFLIKGLNIFQKNGIETTIIWGWKVDDASLSIQGRQAETDVTNWLKNSTG